MFAGMDGSIALADFGVAAIMERVGRVFLESTLVWV